MEITANLIDIGILGLVILSLLVGLLRGFVKEVISLTTWVAAFAFALLYVQTFAEQLPFSLHSDIARLGMAFAIIFFGVLIIGSLVNYLITTAVSSIGLGGVDRFFGALFGVVRAVLIVSLAVILLELTALPSEAWWKESRTLPLFEYTASEIRSLIPQAFSDYLERELNVLTDEPEL